MTVGAAAAVAVKFLGREKDVHDIYDVRNALIWKTSLMPRNLRACMKDESYI